MSYLISIAVQKQKDGKYKWAMIGPFGGMNWYMNKSNPAVIHDLNRRCLDFFSHDDELTITEEKLKKAPVDEIIVIKSESKWTRLKQRNRVHNPERLPLQNFLY